MMPEKVNKIAFNEFLIHGVGYAFPQQPGVLVEELTAHSAEPLTKYSSKSDKYV
jgi:hypothetical protein